MTETVAPPEKETALPPAPEDTALRRRPLTREEYHQAAEFGLFAHEDVELIHGEVYEKMSPQSRSHMRAILNAAGVLMEIFKENYYIQQQGPLSTEDSEPEPDVAVLPGNPDDYTDHPPCSAAVLLVEVSDTTLKGGRTEKASLYAEAGVRDYWIVNLKARAIEVYREPAALEGLPFGHGYKSVRLYTEAETVSPLAAPNAIIPVARLLPRV